MSVEPRRRYGLNRGTPKLAFQLPEIVRQALELRASNEQTTAARVVAEILTEQLAQEIGELQQHQPED